MDRLWAPWRIRYIQRKKTRSCFFCRAAKSKNNRLHYVILRSDLCFSMLNLFPYNNGHIMVSTKRHIGDLEDLKDEEVLQLIGLLKKAKCLLDYVLKPQGYNIGINLGRVSGAGIAGHLHIHLVPRWQGDTNFMPVTSSTKVVSQSLKGLYKKLVELKLRSKGIGKCVKK